MALAPATAVSPSHPCLAALAKLIYALLKLLPYSICHVRICVFVGPARESAILPRHPPALGHGGQGAELERKASHYCGRVSVSAGRGLLSGCRDASHTLVTGRAWNWCSGRHGGALPAVRARLALPFNSKPFPAPHCVLYFAGMMTWRVTILSCFPPPSSAWSSQEMAGAPAWTMPPCTAAYL